MKIAACLLAVACYALSATYVWLASQSDGPAGTDAACAAVWSFVGSLWLAVAAVRWRSS